MRITSFKSRFRMIAVIGVVITIASTAAPAIAVDARQKQSRAKPTIVLVHGAFADSSSWNGVTQRLLRSGYSVIALANPLRDLTTDSGYVELSLLSIPGPIVLVGHSYGGAVITNAARGNSNVKALVYIAGFAPDKGESAAQLSSKFPGSTLGATLQEIPVGDGQVDVRVRPELFRAQFAADVPGNDATLMAVGQRPVTITALNGLSGAPAWRSIPSYFLIPGADKNIPPAVQQYMADRAKGVTVLAKGASHAVLVSDPDATFRLIQRAARASA